MERMTDSAATAGRLGLSAAGAGAAAAGLIRLGRLLPAAPPDPLDATALQRWLAATPIDAVVGRGLWAAALGAAAYLAAVQTFG